MPATRTDAVLAALQTFARQVKADAELASRIKAGPEDQLKNSVRALVTAAGAALGKNVSMLSESPVNDVGRPDLAIAVDDLLVGYIELKAPGHGTTEQDFSGGDRGRNLLQLKKFRNLPNLIYTDANDWTFYQRSDTDEKSVRKRSFDVRLGDLTESGDREITGTEAGHLLEMFREFLKWQPIVPTNARALAQQLAPLTRVLRTDVEEAVTEGRPAFSGIYEDWKRTLFPDATADEFADSYAQTVAYGLLLAKLSGATTLETHEAARAIQHHSSLLARTLEILTQQGTRAELGPGLQLLERTIDAVDPAAIRGKGDRDPWLYFYEDFLAVYDPKLRNERGVYYTPAQVVKAQVTLVDELLKTKLGKPDGVADGDVTVLDPALGTGTYLLSALQHGVDHVATQRGPGAAGAVATRMARNLYGFELLVGPYAVAHLRMTQAIHEAGGREPADGTHIYLTDTLESPNESGRIPHSYFEAPLAEEHRRAREVKQKTKILVCIGNPPYDRELHASGDDVQNRKGGWIRFGDHETKTPLMETFLAPAREAGQGLNIRSVYDDYVYFWRWALWKVFEMQDGPGIVSFITNASYLRGPGFVGMREEMRRTFDELWILDLEGEGRGTRTSENVFAIRAPVAIAVGIRTSQPMRDVPATVRYARIRGSRDYKYETLEALECFDDVDWIEAPTSWRATFEPLQSEDYFDYPLLADLFPWRHPGVQFVRTWPISFDTAYLESRWQALISSSSRAEALHETRDRKAGGSYKSITDGAILPPLNQLDQTAPTPKPTPYLFRSFDRQWALVDARLGDYLRPQLVQTHSEQQFFLSGLLGNTVLGHGPGIYVTNRLPDLHHFSGRGGKDVIPLYRDAAAREPNITHGLLDLLGDMYGEPVTPEDLIGYIAGVLGHPGYTERFHDELEVPGPRVPLTRDAALFRRAVDLGQQVIAWQTYAERFPASIGATQGHVPKGKTSLLKEIPEDPDKYPVSLSRDVRYDENQRKLHVGEGVFSDVDPRIWAYEVSGLRVVRSWLGYRMKERTGRKSSPLDDIRPERWTGEMTWELQDLLWVLEGAIALEPAQDALLAEIVAGELYGAEELPVPTDAERAAPKAERQQRLL